MQFDHDKGDSLDTFYQSFLKNNEALLVKKTDDDGNPRSCADIKPGEGQGNIVPKPCKGSPIRSCNIL